MAAALMVSPKAGSYDVGSTFSVGIVVNASDVAFNAVSGKLAFPQDTLEVVSISKASSVISLWVQEPSFSNSAGSVSFEGIVLNPGYKGSSGKVVTVNFRVKKTGTANVSFIAGEILANDGNGTSILSSLGTGSYSLVNKVTPPPYGDSQATSNEVVAEEKDFPANSVEANVASDSHPSEAWSNQLQGTFTFGFNEGVTALRLLVDDKPDSVPVVVYQPPIKEKALQDLTEGLSYLHVQFKNKAGWGEVIHYKLQIDTTAPEQISVKEITPRDNSLTSFLLTASDSVSGIDRYEVSIDGAQPTMIPVTGPETVFSPSGLVAGIHTMEVKTFDKAGNFTITSQQFEIKGELGQSEDQSLWKRLTQNTNGLLMGLILIPFILLIGFLLFIYLLTRARQQEQQIALARQTAKHDAVRAIMLLRTELESEITLLVKTQKKRTLSKEESKILKGAQKSFADSEEYIEEYFSETEQQV
jgi:Bacterial Ig-like domain